MVYFDKPTAKRILTKTYYGYNIQYSTKSQRNTETANLLAPAMESILNTARVRTSGDPKNLRHINKRTDNMAQKTMTTCPEMILHHEGGYVNHPKDPGGETNLGVTKRVYEDWGGTKDMKDSYVKM